VLKAVRDVAGRRTPEMYLAAVCVQRVSDFPEALWLKRIIPSDDFIPHPQE
jgi:hypothetical protein